MKAAVQLACLVLLKVLHYFLFTFGAFCHFIMQRKNESEDRLANKQSIAYVFTKSKFKYFLNLKLVKICKIDFFAEI